MAYAIMLPPWEPTLFDAEGPLAGAVAVLSDPKPGSGLEYRISRLVTLLVREGADRDDYVVYQLPDGRLALVDGTGCDPNYATEVVK